MALNQVISLELDSVTRDPRPTTPETYQEALKLLTKHYAPTQRSDVLIHLDSLTTLRADDGRGYTQYRQEVEHALRSLRTAGRFPDARTLLSYLAAGTSGLSWSQPSLDQYLIELNADAAEGAAAPAAGHHVALRGRGRQGTAGHLLQPFFSYL